MEVSQGVKLRSPSTFVLQRSGGRGRGVLEGGAADKQRVWFAVLMLRFFLMRLVWLGWVGLVSAVRLDLVLFFIFPPDDNRYTCM